VITRLHPGLIVGRDEVPALAKHITRFSLAGVRAIAAAAAHVPAAAPRAAKSRRSRS
jgi:hypothetical protein